MTEDEPPRGAEGQGRGVPRLRLALLGIAALLVVTLPLWAPLMMRRMDFFRVRRLEIIGTRYIATSDIVARANVDTMRSVWDPMGPITDRVESHPGVETVNVRRKLPGTLVITVSEHQPIALVPGPQGFRVFDARGVALPIDPSVVAVDVPVLSRADTALLRLLAELRADLPGLYRRVSELKRVGAHELLFQLDAAPVRTLGTVTVDDLHQILSVEADLRKRAARVAELDLRYAGQIIARLQ
ncbi:MAG: FtsQ-type POTRA domain-containing protein [Gemmatimonadaceae bacterium]